MATERSGEWLLSASYAWIDERQYDVFDNATTRAGNYYRLDAMLGWYSPASDLRVIVSGRNLTGEDTWTSLERVDGLRGGKRPRQ